MNNPKITAEKAGATREYWMFVETRLSSHRMIWPWPPLPHASLPSATCLSFSIFMCRQSSLLTGWGKGGAKIIRRQRDNDWATSFFFWRMPTFYFVCRSLQADQEMISLVPEDGPEHAQSPRHARYSSILLIITVHKQEFDINDFSVLRALKNLTMTPLSCVHLRIWH